MNDDVRGSPCSKARPVSRSLVLAIPVALAGCGPLRTWDAHTTSSPTSPALDVASVREPVATLGILAPAGLQGFGPMLSHSLADALAQVVPSLRVHPVPETLNAINEHGLAAQYTELVSDFRRSGLLDRPRLHAVGSALHAHYVLLPGMTGFDEVMADHLEVSGLKIVQSRITTLRLWLQLWDVRTGRMLWESAGEARVASDFLRPDSTVPFEDTAGKLWARMLREGLLGDRPGPVERRFR
jgi:hypothetical protein